MNLDHYQNLVNYLGSDEIPLDLTDYEKRTLIRQSKYYQLKDKLLYKKNRKDPDKPIRVIK